MKKVIALVIVLSVSSIVTPVAQSKTSKPKQISLATSKESSKSALEKTLEFPSVCGIWEGKVDSDGIDLIASLKLFPNDNNFEGSLTAEGHGGTSRHYIAGHYDQAKKLYVFHDTRVERVVGDSTWKPAVMTEYLLRLSPDKKSLSGSCRQFASSSKITLSLQKMSSITKDQILEEPGQVTSAKAVGDNNQNKSDADSDDENKKPDDNNLDDLAFEVRRASATYSGGADYFDYVCKEGAARWPKTMLPIKVYISPGDEVHNYRDTYRQSIITSFNDWVKASNYRLSWRLVPKKDDANIICAWVGKKEELPVHKHREQGVTDYAKISRAKTDETWIEKVVITICTTHLQSGRALKNDDVFNIARHEVGHSLGLTGHSNSKADVMYPVMPNKLQPLSMRDTGTINHLYAYYTTTPWD